MTRGLKNSNLPTGAIVLKQGSEWHRNDGVKLRPAEKNPWYVLATAYGEQGEGYDFELVARNRRIWNGWACSEMSDVHRAELAEKLELPVEELAPLTKAEQLEITIAFLERVGNSVKVPAPGGVAFGDAHFSETFAPIKYVFPGPVDFSSAHFAGEANFDNSLFMGNANFASAYFSHEARFTGTYFSVSADFLAAYFQSAAQFSFACVDGDA